jgi:hypothetical protein
VLAEENVYSASVGGAINMAVSLSVDSKGAWTAKAGTVELHGQHPSLGASGALASGRIGIYDAWTSASAMARTVDAFEALGAESAGRVCYSGRQVEFNAQGCQRQDSTGVYNGAPTYRGSGLYLEPEGKLGLINRVAIRMRRNDNEVEEDAAVTDKHSVEVKVRERFLIPR